MTWRAKLSVGAPLGFLFITLVLVIDAVLLNGLLRGIRSEQINVLTFLMGLVFLVSIPLMLIVAYQSVSCLTLRYRLDRNGIVIRWAGTEKVIPIRNIQRIVPGSEISGSVVRRQGLRWPGHERGTGRLPGIGRTRFLATRPLQEQLLLVTPGQAFGISPRDPQAFIKAYEVRQELGPNRLLAQETHPVRWLTWPLWADQTAWLLLGAAIVVNLGLFGYLSARFPGLDVQLPLHFNAEGMADRIGNKAELFALPIIGLLILGVNLVLGLILYRRERAGSYLLWGAAAAVQTLFWLATFSILP